MSARATTIAGEIATIIGGLTTTGGYIYNWGTINRADRALVTSFPSAVIRYNTEEAVGGIAGLYGMQNCEVVISVDYRITPTLTVQPEMTADAALDNALADLLRAFSLNNTGYLPISKEAVLTFKSSEKVRDARGNTYHPTSLVTKWNLYYHNS